MRPFLNISNLILLSITIILLSSCGAKQPGEKGYPKRTALSSVNVLSVVSDKQDFTGNLSDSVLYHLEVPFQILPQYEPTCDILYFSFADLQKEPVRRTLRSYVVLGVMENKESKITQMIKSDIGSEKLRTKLEEKDIAIFIGKDKWARNQTVIYVVANTEEDLAKNFRSVSPKIIEKVQSTDLPKIGAAMYAVGQAPHLNLLVKDTIGIDIRIPKPFKKAIADSNFIWLRKETDKASLSLVFSKFTYEDPKQLSYDGVKEIQNLVGRNISTSVENTHKVINDRDLPMLVNNIEINGYKGVEVKNIWEMDNDFLGGPSISYVLINKDNPKELIYMEGFVMAPGEETRNYMQHLKYILKTVGTKGRFKF